MDIYEVGGCVRDRLLDRDKADRDWVVVGASAAEMEQLGYRRVGKDFPVYLHPETHEEYALARTERKTGRGYYGFSVDASAEITLEEDLSRRDLTINAMARAADGTLIDPYGGRSDLDARILRHVSPAFVEDPLRVLRVARFAARLDFTVAPETNELMREIARSGELQSLAPERVWSELERALNEPHPARFLLTLRDCDALAELFPEIDCLFGVPQPPKYHPEIDTGEHICLALQRAAAVSANSIVRFAVLVHDLGKGTTNADMLPSHKGHEERGVTLVENFCNRFRVPKAFRGVALAVTAYHLKVHCALELRPATLLRLLYELDALRRPERLDDILAACEIDATGRGGDFEHATYPAADYLRQAREVIARVDTSDLRERKSDGEALRAALDGRRADALREFCLLRRQAPADNHDD
ncbi:MAG: multifunctional CCA addition/repair protein [Gammaproteobacteria bacterium]